MDFVFQLKFVALYISIFAAAYHLPGDAILSNIHHSRIENTDSYPTDNYVGKIIDRYNNVPVFYNGNTSNVSGRTMTADGYNLGLKYQCVEFVKRYYYKVFDHKMPNSYGHAKDFFDLSLNDGALNTERDLLQFQNGSSYHPQKDDILIFDGHERNEFGHTAIIMHVSENECIYIQQNVGTKTREKLKIYTANEKYYLASKDILGWLRMK